MKRLTLLFFIVILFIGCSNEPKTIDELKQAGEKAFLKKDYPQARKYLAEGLLKKSSDRDMLYYMGMSFQRELQFDSALFYLKRADILYPNDRELNRAIYQSAKEINDYEDMLGAINVFIKNGDPEDQYLKEEADLNLRVGNVFLSFLQFRKIYEKGSDDPNVYLAMANLAGQVDSVDLAIQVMADAIKKFGEKIEFVTNYAIFLASADRLSEAEAALRKLLKEEPDSQAAQMNLANVLTMYKSRKKKIEGYHLYKELYDKYGNVLKLDSTVHALQQELDIKE